MSQNTKIVIVIGVLVAAFLAVWFGYKGDYNSGDISDLSLPADPSIEKLRNMSDSDETSAIEKDLSASDYSGLDRELNLIEKELAQ